jgi:antirestriction protein ArdC
LQRPDASVVAGYQRWRELGRFVRKGETGIKIIAPCRYRTTVEATDGGDDTAIEAVRGFRVATVFALEQTDGEPLPEMPISRLTGNDPAGCLDALRSYAESLGYHVDVGNFDSPHKCGETNFITKIVTLRCDLSQTHMQKTMFHELAHIALHSACNVGERSLAELEAESVAWICCDAVGIAADDYSFA